jgi:peptidoglycan/xylan/chitin deacetylase (PgdA/CDA1 family)
VPPQHAILTYHSLDDSGSVISVSPAAFARQMAALTASGVRVVRLPELRSAPGPAVALTFDDGFVNFAGVAAPVLSRYGFPATVFLVTDYCGKQNDWPGQWSSVPRLPLMDWPQIRDLSATGFDFGAHTATHPDLSRLDPGRAAEEVAGSKRRIEDALGCKVESFAYPYGGATPEVRRLVAEHFVTGCSTRLGYVTPASPREALERLDVYYLSCDCFFRSLFGRSSRWYLGLRGAARALFQ